VLGEVSVGRKTTSFFLKIYTSLTFYGAELCSVEQMDIIFSGIKSNHK